MNEEKKHDETPEEEPKKLSEEELMKAAGSGKMKAAEVGNKAFEMESLVQIDAIGTIYEN
ncbi:MAG TPA: hypothetical protein EYN79_09120 [Planctomycetes bacterium]|nr:hypothetical protein [Planctomycetota bacterium]